MQINRIRRVYESNEIIIHTAGFNSVYPYTDAEWNISVCFSLNLFPHSFSRSGCSKKDNTNLKKVGGKVEQIKGVNSQSNRGKDG